MAWVNPWLMVFRHLPRVPLYSVVVNIMKFYRHERDSNRSLRDQAAVKIKHANHHRPIKDFIFNVFSSGILEWITLLHLVCMDLIIYFKNFNRLTVDIYFLIITFILSTCLNYVINRSSLFSVVTKLCISLCCHTQMEFHILFLSQC